VNAAAEHAQAKKTGTKRRAATEGAAEPAAKKPRGDSPEADDATLADVAPANDAAVGASSSGHAAVPEESLLLACRFFDDARVGYLNAADLETLVHLTHWHTSRRWVLGLVDSACRRGRLRCGPRGAA
jgi:hypothetical protein